MANGRSRRLLSMDRNVRPAAVSLKQSCCQTAKGLKWESTEQTTALRPPPSGQVLDAQTMLTHGGDDLNDYRFSLGQPLFTLALTLSGLPALLITIIGLGEGRTHLTHQLTKALVAHRYIGRPVIGLKDFSVAKTLVCKWHLRCCMKFPGVRCFIIVRPWRSAPSSAIGNPLTPRGTAAASPQAHVGRSQVAAGLAWVFDRCSDGYEDLYPLQRGAKADRRGLWANPVPVAPWDWRQQRRSTPQP